MAYSTQWAKKLIRDLPADPEDLLKRRTYRSPSFLRLYFDHLDELIFNDPQAGLKWAAVAPRLVRLLPQPGGPDHRKYLVRAYAILGSAYRATSQYPAAARQYWKALRVADSEAVSALERADLWQRFARLRASQGRVDESLMLLAGAIRVFRGEASKKLGEALVIEGYALAKSNRFSEAIPAFGEALKVTNPRESRGASRVHHSAVHNLAFVVSQSATRPEDAGEALQYVRKARRLIKGQRRSIPRYKLQWVEGLIWSRLVMHRRAEQAFGVARRGFLRLNAPLEIALVSLDLALVHRLFGQWAELLDLAEETYLRCRELSGDTEALAALSLWLDAARARKGATAAIEAARQTIEARMVPGR